jgi:hypothetical protein
VDQEKAETQDLGGASLQYLDAIEISLFIEK